jgi:hypothetical protein
MNEKPVYRMNYSFLFIHILEAAAIGSEGADSGGENRKPFRFISPHMFVYDRLFQLSHDTLNGGCSEQKASIINGGYVVSTCPEQIENRSIRKRSGQATERIDERIVGKYSAGGGRFEKRPAID